MVNLTRSYKMINEDYILKKIKPFLNNENELFKSDFRKIFNGLKNDELRKILVILKNNNIDIILENKCIKRKSTSIDYENLKNLSNEQLCSLYNEGNEAVLTAIIEKNKKLIWSRVLKHKKCLNHKLDDEDLFQSGVIGLIKAVKKFKNNVGANLTTYSVWWIDQSIRRDIIDLGFTIRIPVHMVETILKINRIISKNNFATKEEVLAIASEEGITPETYELSVNLMSSILSTTSINTLVGEDEDSELINFILDKESKSVEEEVEIKMLKETIDFVLGTLTEKERTILELRFGLNDGIERTLEEIGQVFGVTRERIRQIEARALSKLSHPSRSKKLKNYLIEE